jgi:predicted metalloprotease
MYRLFNRKLIVTAVALGVLAAACAQEADDNPLVLAGGEDPDEIGEDQPTAPEDPQQLIDASISDVEAYWIETYPEIYGEEWQPLQGGHVPYGPDSTSFPCEATDYETIAANAFYCRQPFDLIAWDEVNLVPPLAEGFGGFTVATVFAHEYGHAAQGRSGFEDETLWMEQQADCFAGAWTAWIADGNSDNFSVAEDTLDFTIAGFISFSDVAGSSAADQQAHGSGFDRVSAFQDGYADGAQRCVDYEDPSARPDPTEIPFLTAEEEASGGNMATDELLPLVEQNLNVYYGVLFDELGETWEDVTLQAVDPSTDEVDCSGDTLSGSDLELASIYCEDEHTVLIGSDLITEGFGDLESLEEIGDFAIGAEIGRLYARAAQIQVGLDEESEESSRLADCMTGHWAQQIFPTDEQASTPLQEASDEEGSELVLSAGDLDEAVMAFLTYGRALDEADTTAFERFAALRLGFRGSIDDCQEQYGQLGGD